MKEEKAKKAVKPNAGFMKELKPSKQLAGVVGAKPLARTEVIKRIWEYIKTNKCQDATNKRMINCDKKLADVFGKPQVSMFEIAKLIGAHLS